MISAGMLNIDGLSKIAQNDKEGDGVWADTEVGKKYSKKVAKLIPKDLTGVSGFYFWVSMAEGKCDFVYVGQSHDLRRRLSEGLKHERIAFWVHHGFDINRWVEPAKIKHPKKWMEYEKYTVRAARKAGTTHIIWVARPKLAHYRLELIEAILIEELRPPANSQNIGEHKDLKNIDPEIKNELSLLAKHILQEALSVIGSSYHNRRGFRTGAAVNN